MSLRINYNLASSSAQRGLGTSQDLYSRMASRLSTGLRINQAADDTAGMAVSEKLKNQVVASTRPSETPRTASACCRRPKAR